ncbi:DsbA family protein [Tsukamurella sp. DT100]|uniref:DsbA family protein n=1 Tax=Tsukamurella sp. DT100 TaxID=3393415 RepID=UPI003CF31144
MTRTTKVSIALITVFVIGVAAALWVNARGDGTAAASTQADPAAAAVVRPDSRRLSSAPDGKATFVEFLDFECEACGAAFPAIERLRAQYGDRVTFVVRYFPIPSHFNAQRAALAVESAARQGRFEQMYTKMYQTQKQWGEQRTPMDDLFRTFAADLGLDLARYDRDYTDPSTAARIQADVDDGKALGVQGTPTFFVNGRQLTPNTYEDLTRALDDALR